MKTKMDDVFMEYSRMVGNVMCLEDAKEVLKKIYSENRLSSEDVSFLSEMLYHEFMAATLGKGDRGELEAYESSLVHDLQGVTATR